MPDPTDPNVTAPAKDLSASAASSADETAPAASGRPKFGPPAQAGEVGTLGPYRVAKQLGAGGMGAVYLAVDTRLDRKLALKVMLPEFAANREAKERFLREARSAAQISHDNVVTVYEADERNGVPYIAMQFLQGYPLDEYLKTKGAPPLTHVIRIAREAALGLAAAHELGLVHRDIKPGNLWLESPNGRVKVLDFGLAKPVGSEAELTSTGAVVGTPAYMSPEQARGLKIDARTDLFSLGALLYRLCTGRTPFDGPNVMAVLMALGSDDPTPVRELNPNVPEPLAQLIHQLLSKKPEQRPQTAAEVAKRLRGVLDGVLNPGASAPAALAPSASDLSVSQPVVVQTAPLQPPNIVPMHVTAVGENAFAGLGDDPEDEVTRAEAEPPRELRKGGKGVLIGAAVAALLAVGVVAVVIAQMGKKGDPTAERGPDAPAPGDGRPKPVPKPGLEPWTPGPPWQPVAIGQSPFDKLDANEIPKEERFDWQPKELVAVIGTHSQRAWGGGWAGYSPDNKYVVSGTEPATIWEVATGTPKWTLTNVPNRHYTPAGFRADGKRLFVTQHAGVVAFDLTDSGPKPVKASPDGVPLPIVTREPHRNWASAEGGKTLLYGAHWGIDTAVELYDASGAEPRKTAELTVKAIAFAAGADQLVYAAADGKLHRATVRDGKFADDAELAIPFGPKSTHFTVSPDATRLCFRDEGKPLHVWDIAANPPKKLHEFPFEHLGVYNNYALAPGGRWLADRYSSVRVRRIDGPTAGDWLVLEPHGAHGESTVTFSTDGTRAVIVSDVGFVRFWDMTGDVPKELTPFDAERSVRPPDLRLGDRFLDSPKGRLTLPRYDGNSRVWALTGAKPVPFPNADARLAFGLARPVVRDRWVNGGYGQASQLHGLGDKGFELVTEAAPASHTAHVSPDGTLLVRVVPDPWRIEAHDLSGANPAPKWTLELKEHPLANDENTRQVHISADNRWLAYTTEANGLAVWRIRGPKPEFYARLPLAHMGGSYRVALSPDGRLLAHPSTGADAIVVEDLTGRAPREVNRLTGGTRPNDWNLEFGWLAFHPDGKKLVAASRWAGVRVMDALAGTVLWEWSPPTGAGVHWAEWAHDGRHLFLHLSNKTIYVLRLDVSGAADRAAAEWALGVGGQITVVNAPDERVVTAATDLPTGFFRLKHVQLSRAGDKVADADLARLKGLGALNNVHLSNARVTDAGLAYLAGSTTVTSLEWGGAPVTGTGLAHLAQNRDLQSVQFFNTPLTDGGLLYLKGMAKLTHANLNGTKLTDACSETLASWPLLVHLSLSVTGVTDATLDRLHKSDKLGTLFLQKTRVTAGGVERLAKALPNCRIEWDGGVIEPKK